ncbi:protein kinase [Ktedonobacter sp. SOSP1-85]|uniref:protein kinase domain-containing protein n=1 Tax=Ktedonobacter sp. SOSP1-85 TaxID=2778367 RepID=UPI0019167977|nr:protein kinase [Ktedonobacter sp. SOSP1-85]
MALPIGTILDGKFKIVQILGEGGMGTVYKVEQLGTNPPYYYAVKELLISPNTSEEERNSAVERFNKEIALLRSLKHPRIAALMLPFQDRGNYYFAMEFVPGRSLEKILEDSHGPLPEEQVVKWMMQVCEALTYIHSRTPPIILRDLKPGNIMITPDNEVQLIDFGIARRFDPNKRTNTENLGTISYASPEHLGSITTPGQRRSVQNPGRPVQTDARADIYSLGATIFHLLTNYEPDPIQTPAPGSILAKNPRLLAREVGGKRICPVEQVIIKAMQQDREQRFQSAEAMRNALLSCLPASVQAHVAVPTVQIPAMSPATTITVKAQPASTVTAAGPICPRCGFHNRPGAKFCKRDGYQLVQGAVPPPQARMSQPILARPVRQPLQARSSSILARPVGSGGSIQARPVAPSNGVAPASDPTVAYRAGLQALNNKNYAEAVNQLKLALSQGGTPYDILYNLGRAYRQYGLSVRDIDQKLSQENMKYAAEQFEAALQHSHTSFNAYFQLGMCYRDLSLLPQAGQSFKKALSLNPDDPAVYYQLGLTSLEQGSFRDAESYLREGLRLSPEHALMLVALGRLYGETKRTRESIEALRHAVQIDASSWEAWYQLGRAHMRAKEWKYAVSAFERARKTGAQNPNIYSALANCYLKLNRKAEARQMLDEALKRDRTNAEALRLLKQI